MKRILFTILLFISVKCFSTNYTWNSSTTDIVINNTIFGTLHAGDTVFIPVRSGGYASMSYDRLNSGASYASLAAGTGYIVVYFQTGAYMSPSAGDNYVNFMDNCVGLKIYGLYMRNCANTLWRLGNSQYGSFGGVPHGYSSWICLDSARIINSAGMTNEITGNNPAFAGDTNNMYHHWWLRNCVFDSSTGNQYGGAAAAQFGNQYQNVSSSNFWRDAEVSGCLFDHGTPGTTNPTIYINLKNVWGAKIHNNIFRALGQVPLHPAGHASLINMDIGGQIYVYSNFFGPDNFGNDFRVRGASLTLPQWGGRSRFYNNIISDKRKYPVVENQNVSSSDLSALGGYAIARSGPETYNNTAYNLSIGVGNTPYIMAFYDSYTNDTVTVKNNVFTQVRDSVWSTVNPRIVAISSGSPSFFDTTYNKLVQFFANSGLADSSTWVPASGGILHNTGAAIPSWLSTDYYGNPRIFGGQVDIGAVERQSGGSGNAAPIAIAGVAQSITLPVSTVTMGGSGSDPDGTVVSQTWSQVSGTTATITTPSSYTTTITGLTTAGVRIFRLTITDNLGATGTSDVTINVAGLPISGETSDFITYDTTITLSANDGGAQWNLRISRPRNYFTTNHPDTASRPAIIFMVGSGEITTPSYMQIYGPHYQLNNGWDGGIDLGNGRHYPLIITVQPYTTGPTTRSTGGLLLWLISKFHIKPNGVHLTGLSMGAIQWERLLNAERSYQDYTYLKKITSIVALSGSGNPYGDSLQGSPWVLGDPPYKDQIVGPNWTGMEKWVTTYHGKYFSLEGTSDNVQAYLWFGTQAMNAAQAGSAYFGYYPNGHCCWNSMYDVLNTNWNSVTLPLGSFVTTKSSGGAPNTQGSYLNPANIFTWELKQGDTTLVGSVVTTSPTAYAGAAQTIVLPVTTVTLTGTGTANNGGTITTYAWTQVSGATATITSASSATTTVTGLTTAGAYTFRLTVTDNSNQTDFNDIIVTVSPTPSNLTVTATNTPQTISISTATITSSSTGAVASVKWTKFKVPNQTNKKFTVFGSSTAAGNGSTATDSSFVGRLSSFYIAQGIVTTIYNHAIAGTDQWGLFDNGNALLQSVLAENPDVALMAYPSNGYRYHTFADIKATFQRVYDSCTNRGIVLYISGTQPRDEYNSTDRAQLKTINDSLLVWYPSRFIDFWTPLTNTVDFSIKPQYGSGDGIHPNNAGHKVIYDKVVAANIFQNLLSSGTVITTQSSANTGLTNMGNGIHKFQISVTDSGGFSASAISQVTNNVGANIPPVANGGGNQTIQLPTTSLTLSGSGTDADGTIVSYAWSQISVLTGTITSPSSAITTVTGLNTTGIRTFRLTVTDNQGATNSNDITVTVNPANQPPVANAGGSQTIQLPTSSISLSGSAIDPDGSVSSYAWTQISGTTATISSPSSASTTVTGLSTAGTRVFRLTATDNQGLAGTNDVTIVVNAAPNIPPVANAGINQTIQLPTSSLTLSGGATDVDGTIASYAWTQISGTTATIASPSTQSTNVTGLTTAGVRVFQLTVTDNQGATGSSTTTITVNAVNNILPISNAGAGQTINLPTSTVTLSGSGTDADGTIVAYAWSQVSGTAATIASASSAVTNITGLSTTGTRVFRLTVTDNLGATAISDVAVIVNPANVTPPATICPVIIKGGVIVRKKG